jgi:hypothetical protein
MVSFAKTTAPLLCGHRDCLESWSPANRNPIGGTRLAGLRTLARTYPALDGCPSRKLLRCCSVAIATVLKAGRLTIAIPWGRQAGRFAYARSHVCGA